MFYICETVLFWTDIVRSAQRMKWLLLLRKTIKLVYEAKVYRFSLVQLFKVYIQTTRSILILSTSIISRRHKHYAFHDLSFNTRWLNLAYNLLIQNVNKIPKKSRKLLILSPVKKLSLKAQPLSTPYKREYRETTTISPRQLNHRDTGCASEKSS